MRGDRQRLLDILEAVANLEKYASKGYEEFSSNELIRIWITYHLQVIGEAAANLSTERLEPQPNGDCRHRRTHDLGFASTMVLR